LLCLSNGSTCFSSLLFFFILLIVKAFKTEPIHDKGEIAIRNKKTKKFNSDHQIYLRLKNVMEREELYRNPELTLESLAENLKVSSGYLSQIINKTTGDNFSRFLNQYRVEDVKKMLLDSEFNKYSLVAIGYEAGFNSKSTYYSAFKKMTSLTPKEYQRKVLIKQ